MILATFGLWEALWTVFSIFLFVAWFWVVISIVSDLFRDDTTSGSAKALWVLFVIVTPYLGMFVYLMARGGGMAERAIRHQQQLQAQMDSYVRETAGSGGPAAEIASAKALLDAGAIDQAEFEQLKRKALG